MQCRGCEPACPSGVPYGRLQEGVRETLVLAADNQLVAYLVAAETDAEALKAVLREQLPDYMVPTQWVLLPAFPLTPNGKIDRNALPAPELAGRPVRVAPRDDTEKALAAIWREVLEVDEVGVDDNFFELGGDSLRVLKMLSKVRARPDLSIELKLRDVIARPTIGELSGYTDGDVALDPLLLLNSRVTGAKPLFCLHAGFGTVFDYEPLARRLEGHCSVYGVQCRMLLDRNWQDDSLQAMAIDYAQYIRQKQPEGPYQLAGWSLGGTLAVLVAQELEAQGQQVWLLGLVDSFIPTGAPATPAADWSADLGSFLSVLLGLAKEQLVLPAVAAGSGVPLLERLIEEARSGLQVASAFASVESAELAHTFAVAMRLKALSERWPALPATRAAALCWWAGDHGQRFAVHGSGENHAVAAGHYDILKHREVIEGLAARLVAEPVMG